MGGGVWALVGLPPRHMAAHGGRRAWPGAAWTTRQWAVVWMALWPGGGTAAVVRLPTTQHGPAPLADSCTPLWPGISCSGGIQHASFTPRPGPHLDNAAAGVAAAQGRVQRE